MPEALGPIWHRHRHRHNSIHLDQLVVHKDSQIEIYIMVTRVVCQTQKLLMLQVVIGSSRGENAGDHIQFQICFWFDCLPLT